jgi:hypothetical protein
MNRLVLVTLLAVGSGAAGAADPDSQAEALEAGNALLARYTTERELNTHLGHKPFACAVVGENRSICSWNLGNHDSRWSALARSVPTDDRINVVCELPADGSARAPDACSIHPRRSNRYQWKPNPGSTRKRMKNRFDRETQKQRQQRARALLEAARTPLEVSRLVGEGPQQCGEERPDLVRCAWYANARTLGQGTLAMVIDAPISKKIRMYCGFPADGSPRELEACAVEVGPRPREAP